MPIFDLLQLVIETFPLYLQRLDLLMIVGVVLLMIYGQYRRFAVIERQTLGYVKNPPGRQMGKALIAGALGGILATAVFIVLGVALNETGILYLWMLAILLMLIHPRFLCFSYGAGILAFINLLFGVPKIDIPAVMALVAVLHLVEAVLIYFTGGEGATPVYVRDPKRGVVGGFVLQKFWPLPLMALVAAMVTPDMLEGAQGVSMPQWWPIIRPQEVPGPGLEYAFALFPVLAALGYSDIALTCTPEVKARRTSVRLLAYSLGLLALAVLAQYHIAFAFGAALFSPLAHEWVIRLARTSELEGDRGYWGRETMILDVKPDTVAERAGLGPGDVITAVNGYPVRTRRDLAEAMEPWAFEAEITVENVFTGERRIVRCDEKIPPLGVMLVPGVGDTPFMAFTDGSGWGRRFRRRLKRLFGRSGRGPAGRL